MGTLFNPETDAVPRMDMEPDERDDRSGRLFGWGLAMALGLFFWTGIVWTIARMVR